MDQLPAYYTSFRPFRKLFQTGFPILTYHKLGPRPRDARLKGLYVPPSLFDRQLNELRQYGYSSGSLSALPSRVDPPGKQIILTFDDGFSNVLTHGLDLLRRHDFRAIQFLVADLIGQSNRWDESVGEAPEPLMDASQVREWLSAGHEIGSHSLTHPYLSKLPIAQAREEIHSSKKKLEDQFGRPVAHFCYPYGDCSEALAEEVRAAGYLTGSTTRCGVHQPGENRYLLPRITARYRSRKLSSIFPWLWR